MNQLEVRAEQTTACLDVIRAAMKVHDAAPSLAMAEATIDVIRASVNVDVNCREVAR